MTEKGQKKRGGKIIGRVVRRVKKPVGAPPGILAYTGTPKPDPATVRTLKYDSSRLYEGEWTSEQVPHSDSEPHATWIDVVGLHDVETLRRIGDAFSIHPLLLEDVLNPGQRVKTEEYEEMLFIVLKEVTFERTTKIVAIDQITIVLGKNFVITFRDRDTGVLDPVRERLKNGRGQIRKRGVDYLAYALVDCVVDKYFQQLEAIGDEIDELEEEATDNPEATTMKRLHSLRREILVFRKVVWPLREAVGALYRSETPLIEKKTVIYFRDVYDHSVQVIDIVETLRDLLSGMMDLYLSSVSNRMNEAMKVLTIIATIFIPLSFIAGVYGMNFQYMPELNIWWAYPAVLAVMLLTGLGMFWYFRRKKWL